MQKSLFPINSSGNWLLTLQEIAPLIGTLVILIIIVVIVIVIVKWGQYWIKKGLEESRPQQGELATDNPSLLTD
jgi:fructose-specific phosphotransferase system IIC component